MSHFCRPFMIFSQIRSSLGHLRSFALFGTLFVPGCAGLNEDRKPGYEAGDSGFNSIPAEDGTEGFKYRSLKKNGINGGEIVFQVPGSMEEVLDMLLDFENDAARRPWRSSCSLISKENTRYRVKAEFPGRYGINPSVVLVYNVEKKEDSVTVRFFVEEGGFGLKRFEGEDEITPVEGNNCVLRERVFIDSGVPFMNASARDVRQGLTEDAKRIREWMRERLAAGASSEPALFVGSQVKTYKRL